MQGTGRTRFSAALIGPVLGAVFGAVVLVFAGTGVRPQSGETIRLILPFAPGGPAGVMARVVAEQIGATGGPSMVIESHPGAATEIGTEYVYRSEPDGNTLGIISNSFVTLPHLRKLKYDPLTDFAPICDLADFPPLIAVNSTSPYRKLADLIDAAHAQPGKPTLGSIGPGSSSQMAFEMLKREAKANITFVPFAGYTPAIQALLGNQITSVIADLASLQGQLQSGQLRALATMTAKRIESLPDLPTVTESGYDVQQQFFGGVIAPGKTPKQKIANLIKIFSAALQSQEIRTKFIGYGYFPAGACGADYAAILRRDYDDYGKIVQETGMKME
jgi:tripartite-type tricarboxylate transporter receptor subunit TctC